MPKQPTNKSLILEFAKQGKEFNGIDAWQYVVARKPGVSKRSVQATLHQLKENDELHSPGRNRFHIAGGRRGASADSKKITANKRPADRARKKKSGSMHKYYGVYKAAFESSEENILETRELVEAIKAANPDLSNPWGYPKRDSNSIDELVSLGDGRYAWLGSKPKGDKAHSIESYGVHWQRDDSGITKIQVLGEREDEEIDRTDAKGVYVLYRGEKIVYVGRATAESGMGLRLTAHLKGKYKNRWDTFSFFAVKGNNEDQTIKTMEAVLIEILEPPLNRKSEMNAELEITQVIATEVAKRRDDNDLARIVSKLSKVIGSK